MKSFLVMGLEASCTKYVAKLLAINLEIIKSEEQWDGYEYIQNKKYSITHRSFPHGFRDNFIDENYCKKFDNIILVTRDYYCSLISKIQTHQDNKKFAVVEHEIGRIKLSKILFNLNNIEIYSYESSFLLGETYNKKFIENLGLKYSKNISIKDVNRKHISRLNK